MRKTTAITDMALSQEVIFREKALSLLQKNDMKFPYFPWILFEQELQLCLEHKTVYNLATIKSWVALKQSRFSKHHNSSFQLYSYDYQRYGLTFSDSLSQQNLFDVLSTYAQLYFIYIIQSSLLVTNYSIREDNLLKYQGNFPLWDLNFFSTQSRPSRYSHILDFDILRLGKQLLKDNPHSGSFEFGVVVISEIGKERGNNLELREVKKTKNETNQKNDLFNSRLKMCRHSATVDNFPFIKVFCDEQRPESWGADARDLADVLTIISCSPQSISLPFYTLEESFSDWLFSKFINLYYDFRFIRGDNTLLIYLLKSLSSYLFKRNLQLHNTYGYSTLKIQKENGTLRGSPHLKKYYLMNKKIYSSRFSTDCFSDYFQDKAKRSKLGLQDYIEYKSERATVSELKLQNSYFISSLYDADSDLPSNPQIGSKD